MAKVTAVIVGAGLAGLSAAYALVKEGVDVLVVERGDHPGTKSVTGGRIYFNPVKNIFPELWEECPWERHVVKEMITILDGDSAFTAGFRNAKYTEPPYHSYTVLPSTLNGWLAKKITEKRGRIISKYKVDDVIQEDGKIKGVVVSGAKLEADVVIAADGVMSQVAEKAGLRGKLEPEHYAVGAKEVIEVGAEAIENRFGLQPGEGAANLFLGNLPDGIPGGGFLYTNRTSISLGVIFGIDAYAEDKNNVKIYEVLDDFKAHPEIARYIKDGSTVEYSAHVISECGIKGFPKLYGNGILVTGDAAGMMMNLGIVVRGMDFAVASGALAAKTVLEAKQANDFSAESLSKYEKLVNESFIGKDFNTFSKTPDFLANKNLYKDYPAFLCDTLGKVFAVDEDQKRKISSTLIGQVRNKGIMSLVKDLSGIRKM